MNKKIYLSEELGSVYWLENGTLMFAPMTQDGIVDPAEGGSVEADMLIGEKTANGKNIVDLLKDIEVKLTEPKN